MNKIKSKVAIIDYQMSNLYSVQHACEFVGLSSIITSDKSEIMKAEAAILPGVGAFGDAMNNLKKLDLISPIKKFVDSGRPFMGICLGMQLLFSESEEFGRHQGLDIVKGKVIKFSRAEASNKPIKVPQIGWNQIFMPDHDHHNWQKSPLKNVADGEFMYFVHSYFVNPVDNKVILTYTIYEDVKYCSSVFLNNVVAFQFHPEKSGPEGIKIYQEWALKIKN